MAPKSRPTRYWPGKAPAPEHEEDSDQDSQESGADSPAPVPTSITFAERQVQLPKSDSTGASGVQAASSLGHDVTGEEEMLARRDRIRQKLLQSQATNASTIMEQEEEEETLSESEEESEEEEEDSESDEYPQPVLLKPIFISKSKRLNDTHEHVAESDESELAKKESRRALAHEMVSEEVKRSLEREIEESVIPDIDDTDDINEAAEYEEWKLRELQRIKRDQEERLALENERLEVERRRMMTDEEIEAENKRLGLNSEKAKGQFKFLQKYYHKGAFFLDESSDVFARDFTAPTLEDKFDKSVLPAVMQVKNFGRAGATKWTHLSNEDTSNKVDSAWFKRGASDRLLQRMGGMKDSLAKPTKRAKQ